METDRIILLIRGYAVRLTDSDVNPNPSKTAADGGSAAISPHTVTDLPVGRTKVYT